MCVHTSRWVSLCASRLWICLAMELNTSWRSAPSTSTSSSHWSGSTMRGSWVTCSKDSFSGLYDKINMRRGNSDTKWQIWRWTIQTVWRLGEYQAEMHVMQRGKNYFYLGSVSKKAWLMHAKLMIVWTVLKCPQVEGIWTASRSWIHPHRKSTSHVYDLWGWGTWHRIGWWQHAVTVI